MSSWIQVKVTVKKGHGVASGHAADPRFPQGTIAMQKPFFQACGLDLENYFPGTINLSIAPHQYVIRNAKYTFRNLKWSSSCPAEDFSFFDCRLLLTGARSISGLIYYPHPETKPEHFQTPDILEILAPPIDNLKYGDEIVLAVDRLQVEIL